MTEDRQVFRGGLNTVVRIGSTVRRDRGPWSDRVAALLRHLEDVGFRQAPRYFGSEGDTDVLEFLPGEVSDYPLTPAARSTTALISAAKLLRRYHDATADLVLPGGWMLPDREPAEVICHGDFAPYNCVLRGEEVVGLIDFDTAHPGPRLHDLGYAVYRFAPLTDPANQDGFGSIEEQAARAKLFCDSYGFTDRAAVLESAVARLRDLVHLMRTQAASGHEGFASHLAAGHDRVYLRDLAHIEANRAQYSLS
ncbi:aminoglycoside phosphotransferase family protein [Amycolatopsis sp. AA4]|uniref:aminoglycoside phosphotransferase family protein n=1 Tax=Actinomycetes TaxID=1760 RepID=UPI0001B540F2|nr:MULTISPECIES: aminoglycoside phosphotransferase family protein [Actinomycetes]ATY15460.1 aminoglycoside phosphotransferase family protein [Amycolatopsis sp. AA4]EFL11726.1 phosphotransferase [Streptomyces sp. AA4]